MSGAYVQYVHIGTICALDCNVRFRLDKHVGAFAVVYGIFLSFGELGTPLHILAQCFCAHMHTINQALETVLVFWLVRAVPLLYVVNTTALLPPLAKLEHLLVLGV